MKSLSRNGSLITLLGMTSAAMLGGFAGCSSSSGDDSAVNTDGGPGGDGSTGADGSNPGDGGTGDSGGPTTISTGFVNFTQGNALTPDTFSNSSSAAFYVLPAGTDLDCLGYGTTASPAAAGATCTIKICTNPISADGGVSPTDGGAATAPNTGNITLLSAADAGAGIVITANADGSYTGATGIARWWTGGESTIEVKSAGSATSIAAFDDTALIGPGDISAVKFNSTDITGVSVTGPAFDRGTDLAVTYSGGTTGTKVNVRLTTTSSTQKSMVTCDFDASNGAESIATADLEQLQQAGAGGVTGAYSVQGQNVKATTAGAFNFNVTLGATLREGTFTNTN